MNTDRKHTRHTKYTDQTEDDFWEHFEVTYDTYNPAEASHSEHEHDSDSRQESRSASGSNHNFDNTRQPTAPAREGKENADYGKRQRPADAPRQKKRSSGRSHSPVRALSNMGSGLAKASGKGIFKLVRSMLRMATLLLIAAIMVVIGTRFWNGRTALGNPLTALSEKNYAMGAYLAVGLFLLLFELIAFLRALIGSKRHANHDRRRTATSRGFFSFILTYLGSYLSFQFGYLLPDSPAVLAGLKSALTLYGSMRGILFVLCTAGAISCLVKRFSPR